MEEQMETEESMEVDIPPDDPLSEYLDCFKYFDDEAVERYKRDNAVKKAIQQAREANKKAKKGQKGKKGTCVCYQQEPEPELPPELPPSCNHEELNNEDMLSSYELLHSFYVACITKNSFKRKKSDCICNIESCKKKRRKRRIHACLSCIYFGCYEKRHIHQHGKENRHFYAMDTDSGHIFCSSCEDYIYPPDYTEIARKQNFIASCKNDSTNMFFKWEPTPDEVLILKDALEENELIFSNKKDVRGIVNLGNFTCYFNVLVQCLTNAPVFKDRYLSIVHKCNSKEDCFTCEMTKVVQMCVSDKEEPFHTSELFRSFFKNVKEYATSEQQDSHECLVRLLTCLHNDAAESLGKPDPCNCFIHDTFVFHLRRERRCTVNGCVVPSGPAMEHYTVYVMLTSVEGPSEPSFEELLKRNWNEYNERFTCDKCGRLGGTDVTIPVKLPDIMNFYLWPPKALGPSIETLDMKSFVVDATGVKDKSLEYKYYLCGVVKHFGVSKAGHYVCYIRKDKDTWVLCNDKTIKKVDPKVVFNTEATILFYHKMHMGLKSEVRKNDKEEKQYSGVQSAQANQAAACSGLS